MTKGSYVLVLRLARGRRLTIGKLGAFDFPRGLYLYFGSALNGLEGRIRRHMRQGKKPHWHIDFLTAVAPVIEVWCVVGDGRRECSWARAAAGLGDATVPAPGFGASDCRCGTHLVRLPFAGRAVASARLTILGESCEMPVGNPPSRMGHSRPGASARPLGCIRE